MRQRRVTSLTARTGANEMKPACKGELQAPRSPRVSGFPKGRDRSARASSASPVTGVKEHPIGEMTWQ